ncbi:replication protein P [Vibrio mangrovi]|uniref:Replication protein P n=1 Tax=Vibrio mangrovi TaxID=474394 RepID=A0A1Y6IWN1_9VIBR|nr:replication protein P [Vibrio mangrovi]MDW6005489.1 replication protein P [Vibrio mangrovi]SMS02069.1 Replication protein P [Vibrio mangrovi]
MKPITYEAIRNELNVLSAGSETSGEQQAPDTFAAQIVNMILRELRGIHPAWRSSIRSEQEYETLKLNYVKAMMEQGVNTMALVQRGLRMARANPSDFIPGPGKFCAWCLDDGEWLAAWQRMMDRSASLSRLEELVRNECEFDARKLDKEKARSLFERTYNKWLQRERNGMLPPESARLSPRAVTTEFDRLRCERGVPDPSTLTGIFKRVAELGQRYKTNKMGK